MRLGSGELTRRLACNVISDAGDAINLVHDPPRDVLQKLEVESIGLGGHEVDRRDGTKNDDVSVNTSISLNTHSSVGIKASVGLCHLVVDACFLDHGDEDVISLPDDGHALRRDLANDPDGNAWAWEGMTHVEVLWNTELFTKGADLVLEELSQRLDQLETLTVHHTSRETTDVVMRLDRRRELVEAQRLNDVWVKGTLGEELNLASIGGVLGCLLDLDGLFLEQVDESTTNDLPLRLRLSNTLQAVKEELCSVNDGQVDTEMFLKHVPDLLAFVETHHAVIDKDGMEPVTWVYVSPAFRDYR